MTDDAAPLTAANLAKIIRSVTADGSLSDHAVHVVNTLADALEASHSVANHARVLPGDVRDDHVLIPFTPGVRPSWLALGDPVYSYRIAPVGQGYMCYQPACMIGWYDGVKYYIHKDHWAAPALRIGMKPCKVDKAPDDYEPLTGVMLANGDISFKGEEIDWSKVIGYSDGTPVYPRLDKAVPPAGAQGFPRSDKPSFDFNDKYVLIPFTPGEQPSWLADDDIIHCEWNDTAAGPCRRAVHASAANWGKNFKFLLPADHWAAPALRAGLPPVRPKRAPDLPPAQPGPVAGGNRQAIRRAIQWIDHTG